MPKIRADSIQAHKSLTHQEIVGAAHDLFVRRGFAETSISEVADHVGVARTTVYEYFPNKQELLLGVLRDVVGPAVEHLVSIRPVHDDPIVVLSRMLGQVIRYAVEHRAVADAVLRAGRKLDQRGQDEMWLVLGPYEDLLEELCSEGVEDGLLPPDDPERLARILGDLFLAAVDEVLEADDLSDAALADIITARRRFLERALAV